MMVKPPGELILLLGDTAGDAFLSIPWDGKMKLSCLKIEANRNVSGQNSTPTPG